MADPEWTHLGLIVASVFTAGLALWLLVGFWRQRRARRAWLKHSARPFPSAATMKMRVTIRGHHFGAYRTPSGRRLLSDRQAARERWPWDIQRDLEGSR
jgi:hypothetical protein